jgi:hypothetical protein
VCAGCAEPWQIQSRRENGGVRNKLRESYVERLSTGSPLA